MKFYDSIGPNPQVVKMFMAEKGIELPKEQVDLMAGHNRQEPYLSKNPAGQMPALELDDGVVLCEILPICEYLDETHPNPPLIGSNPEERAITRMWTRRIDLNVCEPMANGFRFGEGLQLFQNRIRTIPEASAGLKETAKEKLAWLDGLVAGRQWVVGDRFTLADILLYVFVEFGAQVGQPLDPSNQNLAAWKDRVAARPSLAARAPAAASA
jgi:glutathione S-transferase